MNEINIVSVLVSTIAGFAFGALWYSPLLFLKPWCKATGVNPNDSAANPARVYGLTFVFTLITAFALAYFLGPQPMLQTAITAAVIIGIGFSATSIGINYQFVDNSLNHWLIDSGFHLGRCLVIASVQASWP